MVFALGMILARLGLVLSGGDEDKEGKYRKELGEQPYSIIIGNKSYTLDWIAPASIPLFMGVKLQESLENEGITEIDGLIGAIASASDPLTELSMLSSLNNTLRTYQSNRVQGMATQAIKNFIAQHIPTLSSQIAKTIDPYRRTTAVTGKENKQARQYINYLKSKIPFLNNTLPPYINVWGNEEKDPNILNRALENMVYPFWIAENNINSLVDNEIMSLFAQTDNKDIIPYIPNSYYTVDGKRYDMTPDEYTQYKKDFGQFSFSQLESLFSSNYYQSLTLEQKEEAITKVYSFARDYARKGKYYELYQLLGNNNKNLSTYLQKT